MECPPEVNVTQHVRTNHQGSESSSVLGDPSYNAQSDTSKTISQLSSAGKRSIAAATQASGTTPQEIVPIPPRHSPIKKQQRARGSLNSQCSDSTDEEHNFEYPPNINLETRFNQSIDELDSMNGNNSVEASVPMDISNTEPETSKKTNTTPHKIHQHTTRQLPRTNNTIAQMVRLERHQNDIHEPASQYASKEYLLATTGATVMAFDDKLDIERISS